MGTGDGDMGNKEGLKWAIGKCRWGEGGWGEGGWAPRVAVEQVRGQRRVLLMMMLAMERKIV